MEKKNPPNQTQAYFVSNFTAAAAFSFLYPVIY